MKYFCNLLLVLVLLSSCTEDEQYIWDYSDFENTVNKDNIQLFTEASVPEQNAYFNLSLAINSTMEYRSEELNYFMEYDSVTLNSNGQNINIDYTILNDSIKLFNTQGVKEYGNCDLTLWGSWYYKDTLDPKYTDGSPVFIETISEIIKIPSTGTIPFSTTINFIDNEFENSEFYVPTIRINRIVDQIYTMAGYNYRFKLGGYLVQNIDTISMQAKYIDDRTNQLDYEGKLETGKRYTIQAIAHWYIQDLNDNWIKCDGFENVSEKEITVTELSTIKLSNDDFKVSYPLYRQCNFLIDEYDKGYLIPNNLTIKKFLADKTIHVVIKDFVSKDSTVTTLYENEEYDILEFQLPTDKMQSSRIYHIAFFNSDNMEILYEYHFRTSYYKSFKEKFTGEQLLISYANSWRDPIVVGSMVRGYNFGLNIYPINEGLDSYEGYQKGEETLSETLIQFESTKFPQIMNDTKEKLMYSIPDIEIYRQGIMQQYDVPPFNAIRFLSNNQILTDDNIYNETALELNTFVFKYMITGVSSMDLFNMRTIVNELYPNKKSVNEKIDGFSINFAPFNISYVLPGINLVTYFEENYVIP